MIHSSHGSSTSSPRRPEREIVHLDVVGVPEKLVDELRHANVLPA